MIENGIHVTPPGSSLMSPTGVHPLLWKPLTNSMPSVAASPEAHLDCVGWDVDCDPPVYCLSKLKADSRGGGVRGGVFLAVMASTVQHLGRHSGKHFIFWQSIIFLLSEVAHIYWPNDIKPHFNVRLILASSGPDVGQNIYILIYRFVPI